MIRSFTTQGSGTPDIRVLPLSLTFDSGSLAGAFEALLPEPQPSINWDLVTRLDAKARQEGAVRVLVRVDVPFVPEGELRATSEIQGQRTAIRTGQESVTTGLEGTNTKLLAAYRYIPYLALELDAAALATLVALPSVATIEEDLPVAPSLASSAQVIGAQQAWAAGYTGTGQVIAVLDTGVDKSHSFFATGHSKVVSEACYSSNTADATSLCPGAVSSSTAAGSGVNCPLSISGCNHGTHVAGIAAGDDGAGPNIGVARGADIIAIQVFSRFNSAAICDDRPAPCARTYSSDQISGLERVYSLRNSFSIAAVNMSLGGGRYHDRASCDANNSAVKAAIDNLRSAKIATVISAGNDDYTDSIGAPACISSAVSVGATDDSDEVAGFSNIASFIDLLAPGDSIQSSIPGGGTASFNGTSMSAPHVAGAWAILKQQNPTATVDEVLALLRNTGTLVDDNRAGGTVTGMRRINVDQALGLSAPGGQNFTIHNDGNGTLSVTSIQLQSAGSWIQWSPQAPFDIAPGGSRQVTVTVDFNDAPAGSSTRRLLISSNDPDESPYPGGVDIIVNRQAPPTCHTLLRTHTGAGSNPSALPANSTGCSSGQYTAGASIQLTANPSAGWSIGSWSGTDNDSSASTTNSITMPAANHMVTVNYVQAPPTCYALTRLVNDLNGGGLPVPTPDGSPGCGQHAYTAGQTIQVMASPAPGWQVENWIGTQNDSSASTINSVLMPASAHTVTTNYVQSTGSDQGADFFTVTPCRLVDTRNPDGPYGGPSLTSGVLRFFKISGQCGIPGDVTAVSMNITVAGPSGQGNLTLFPADQAPSNTSVISFGTGQARGNNTIIGLSADGELGVKPILAGGGQVNLIVDVSGYFLEGHPLVGKWRGTIGGTPDLLIRQKEENFTALLSGDGGNDPLERLEVVSISATEAVIHRPADVADYDLSLVQSGLQQCLEGDYVEDGTRRPVSLCRTNESPDLADDFEAGDFSSYLVSKFGSHQDTVAWSFVQEGASMVLEGSGGGSTGGGDSIAYLATIDPELNDASISVRLKVQEVRNAGHHSALVARFTATTRQFYELWVNAGSDLLILSRRNGTQEVRLASTPLPSALLDEWITLEFEVIGDRLRGRVNGQMLIEVNDSALPVGGVGFGNGGGATRYDNFRVEARTAGGG